MPEKKTTKGPARTAPARPARKAATRRAATRADFGKSIDSFFKKQREPYRTILVELRELIEAAAPDVESSIKWGMPHFAIGGKPYAALGAHKAHVNLILWGPSNAYKDPSGRLSGASSKLGRHLKIASLAELEPRNEIRGWLDTCAHLARTKAA